MRIVDVQQGSQEWHEARAGIPTASQLSRIVTKSGKLSASSNGYLCELLAESAFGVSAEDGLSTYWTNRGTDLEPKAIQYYEFQRDIKVQRVGFALHDDLDVGCSPDFLVGDDGGGEVKCPAPQTHIGYFLGHDDDAYRVQVQSSLWITGRKWWDRVIYSPDGIPNIIRRFERDKDFIATLDEAVRAFLAKLHEARERLCAEGCHLAEIGRTEFAKAETGSTGDFGGEPW